MKLFASDFDGTLSIDKKVSLDNIEAIRRWRAAGNLFAIVTGRSKKTIEMSLNEENIEVDYIVSNNGGFIWDSEFKEIEGNFFNSEVAREVLKDLTESKGTHVSINDGNNRKIIKMKDYVSRYYNADYYEVSLAEVLKDEQYAQFVVGGISAKDAVELQKELGSKYGDYIQSYLNNDCLDVVPWGISKGNAVEKLATFTDIEDKDIYCAGDAHNDLSMLLKYNGATLDSASDEIKEEVGNIYPDVASIIDDILI